MSLVGLQLPIKESEPTLHSIGELNQTSMIPLSKE